MDAIASEDAVQVAREAAEAEARRADAIGDPIASWWRAQASLLGAEQKLGADFILAIERAKLPVDPDALRFAVYDGISAHAAGAVRALSWRNTIAAVALVAVFTAIGFAGGWLASENRLIAAPELGSAITARDAAQWVYTIRMNDIASCKRVQATDFGEACLLRVKPPSK